MRVKHFVHDVRQKGLVQTFPNKLSYADQMCSYTLPNIDTKIFIINPRKCDVFVVSNCSKVFKNSKFN